MENPISEKNRVGLLLFNKVMTEWSQSVQSQMKLLDVSDTDKFSELISGSSSDISQDSLDRISYMMKIYKYLHTIFVIESQANNWVNKANKRFDNLTASEYMILNGRKGIKEVCDHLYAQCQ
jgi:uncharacterized protein (DUF2384 family)